MVEINLLPWREYLRKKKLKMIFLVYMMSMGFIFITLLWLHIYYLHKFRVKSILENQLYQQAVQYQTKLGVKESNKKILQDAEYKQKIILSTLNALLHL